MRALRNATSKIALLSIVVSACSTVPSRPTADGTKVSETDVRIANESIEHMLERKAPGLQVIRDGDGLVLQIRGSSHIYGAVVQPLYVLNGLPFTPGPGGLISGISIDEIDTVKVLRGAEAGLYGIEGANGVIVITTKRR